MSDVSGLIPRARPHAGAGCGPGGRGTRAKPGKEAGQRTRGLGGAHASSGLAHAWDRAWPSGDQCGCTPSAHRGVWTLPGAGDGEALIRRGLGSSVLGGSGVGEGDRSVTLAWQDRGGQGESWRGRGGSMGSPGKGEGATAGSRPQ